MSGIMIEKITSYRVRAPMTLNQFLISKAVQEASASVKQVKGVTRDSEGHLMPTSALEIKNKLSGTSATKLKAQHPEWVSDYPAYLENWKKGIEHLQNLKKNSEQPKP